MIAIARLQNERKQIRKDLPSGFFAKPKVNTNGNLNMLEWECGIPGKNGTIWENGLYPLTITFSEEYPAIPPHCHFARGFFHPNVYPSGTVCLSILNAEKNWKPSITIKEILLCIQDLLDNPNPNSPAEEKAFHTFMNDKDGYKQMVLAQKEKYSTTINHIVRYSSL